MTVWTGVEIFTGMVTGRGGMEVKQGLRERHVVTGRPQHPGCCRDLHAEADKVARDRPALDARHIDDDVYCASAESHTRK